MTAGAGIAIPTPKKPILAVAKGSAIFVRDADGIHTYTGKPAAIQAFRRELVAGVGADPEPQPEPTTRVRRPVSKATKMKMGVSQTERQADLRRQKEAAAAAATPVTKPATAKTTAKKKTTRKEAEKTMAAGATG